MHEPALLAAELAWRWCFGLSAWILGIISIRLFLDSLTVRPVDQFLLHTMQPILLIEALQHIFRGSLSRFLLGQTVLLPGLILLWALAATSGRTATLHRLVAMFRIEPDDDSESARWNLGSDFRSATAARDVVAHSIWHGDRFMALWRGHGKQRPCAACGSCLVLRNVRGILAGCDAELVFGYRATVLRAQRCERKGSAGSGYRLFPRPCRTFITAGLWIFSATNVLGGNDVVGIPHAAVVVGKDRRAMGGSADGFDCFGLFCWS